MLSKAQQVRAYQRERIQARLEKRSLPRFDKYRPDQARDDHGRFADEGKGGGRGRVSATAVSNTTVNIYNTRPSGGSKPRQPRAPRGGNGGGGRDGGSGGGESYTPPSVGLSGEIAPGVHASGTVTGWKALVGVVGTAAAVALVKNPALIGQAIRTARNPKALLEAWNTFIGNAAATAERMRRPVFMRPRPINTTKPPMGGVKPAAPTKAPKGRPLKPASDVSVRTRQRRAKDLAAAQAGDVAAAQRIKANVEATQRARNAAAAASKPVTGTGTAVATRSDDIVAAVQNRSAADQLVAAGVPASSVYHVQIVESAIEGLVKELPKLSSINAARDLADRVRALERMLPPQRNGESLIIKDLRAKLAATRDYAVGQQKFFEGPPVIPNPYSRKRLTKSQQVRKYQCERRQTFAKAGYKPFVPNEQEIAAPAIARQSAGVSRTAAAGVNMTYRRLHGPSPEQRKELKKPKKKPSLGRSIFGGSGVSSASAGRVRFGTYKYRADQARDEQGQFQDEGKGGGGWGRTAAIAAGVLGAGALAANPAARVIAGRLRLARLKALREARHMERGRGLTQPTALERLARQQEAAGLRPKPARPGVLDRANTAVDQAVDPLLRRVPPKVRRELRGGGENPLEFNPFKILDFFH